jgi:hypothetical protein
VMGVCVSRRKGSSIEMKRVSIVSFETAREIRLTSKCGVEGFEEKY